MKKKIVYIVHCVDTEGPLYESLTAKFQRIKDIFNINIQASKENLKKLKLAKIPLGGKEKKIASVLSSHLTNYNSDWNKINGMISKIFSSKFRNTHKDSFGKPWVFNWHCLDHVGYKKNPRKRTLGYHKIFDYYSKVLKKYKKYKDKIHWHFHPMSTYNDAHRCATSYANSPELYQILCRKIIERNYFPSVFRAGFQAERPDSNLFLEQWIPFDITNMSTSNNKDLDMSLDFKLGRSGDWRRAPKDWSIYHPSHDDYQKPGNCRRWIGRALNVMNRIASINQKEIDKAFIQAKKKGYALVGFASHDFRDLEVEVKYLNSLIKKSHKKFNNIEYKFSEAKHAFSEIAKLKEKTKVKPLKFQIKYYKKTKKDFAKLTVKATQGDVFGPQPFLAIKTRKGRFINDNFDFSSNKKIWHYAFHSDTIPIEDISTIGIAANDKLGNTCIKKLQFNKSSNKFI
jgi:hypothetical protein